MNQCSIPRLVISALHSGAGKTTCSIAIAGALKKRGYRVAMFKCGPDYLDPSFHSHASGRRAYNLDGWLMGQAAVLETFAAMSENCDIALIEGVMGLYDGAHPDRDIGSTAEIARWLNAPIVAVVDVSGMAGTIRLIEDGLVAASKHGLEASGLIANYAGSSGHLELIEAGLQKLAYLGGFIKDESQKFPERHLGLHTAQYISNIDKQLEYWINKAEQNIYLDRLIDIGKAAKPIAITKDSHQDQYEQGRCTIAYAWDEAFHFYYPDNLRRLERAGARLVQFSPLKDKHLPPCDGLYIGGGYPEIHAIDLMANTSLVFDIHVHNKAKRPIYAECGGLMYLCDALKHEGRQTKMLGLLPGQIETTSHLQALGYCEVETLENTILGPKGTTFRGHQFRYSQIHDGPCEMSYSFSTRRHKLQKEGFRVGNVLGSYIHSHWASNPSIAINFVESCLQARSS